MESNNPELKRVENPNAKGQARCDDTLAGLVKLNPRETQSGKASKLSIPRSENRSNAFGRRMKMSPETNCRSRAFLVAVILLLPRIGVHYSD